MMISGDNVNKGHVREGRCADSRVGGRGGADGALQTSPFCTKANRVLKIIFMSMAKL